MADRFANRVAVVTGGVSGIGLAIARRLAAEGARLAIWDRDRAALDDAAARIGAPVHADCLDLVDPAAVMAAGVSTAAALGRIDILVACAGITGPNGVPPVDDAARASFRPDLRDSEALAAWLLDPFREFVAGFAAQPINRPKTATGPKPPA